MSVNVGSITVGMNVDLATFEEGMRKANALAISNTGLMSAEMKRQSREGAESLRLIDEAIGVHISRPLTRVISQIPGVGAALQSLFALSATAAIGGLAIEGIVHLGEKIEAARQRQLAAADAWQKLGVTAESAILGIDRRIDSLTAKIIGLTSGKIAALDSEFKHLAVSAEEVGNKADELFRQTEEAQKTSAPGFWDPVLFTLGHVKDWLEPTSAQVAGLEKNFRSIHDEIDRVSSVDAFQKTHNAAALLNKDLQEQLDQLRGMENLLKSGAISQEAVDLQHRIVNYLVLASTIAQAAAKADALAAAEKKGEIAAANAEAATKAIRDAQEEMRGWNQEANRSHEEWVRLNAEIDKAVIKLNEDVFREQGRRMKELAPQITVAPPGGAPMLSDQAELQRITTDQNEAWKKAGEILDQVETPLQKYQTSQSVLSILLKQGRLDQDQYNAAMARAASELDRADIKLRKLLEQTGSARAGFQAFFLQLEIDAQQKGKFTFDTLTKAMDGFESNMAAMLVQGKANWSQFFSSLEADLLKFAMNQTLMLILKQLTGLAGGGFFSSLFGGGGGGGAAAGGGLAAEGFGGWFAEGGDVTPGMGYIVGEQGPELLFPNVGGTIVPHSMVEGGKAGSLYIDARGADAGVEQRLLRAIRISEDRAVARSISGTRDISRRTTGA